MRTAAIRLSPDLSVVGLVSAIKVFADSLSPTTETKVIIENGAEDWIAFSPARAQTLLGIYRIIQQVTLNAAVHGRSQNIQVKFSMIAERDRVRIEILNDGVPLLENQRPGTGTAIINGWINHSTVDGLGITL